MKCVRTLLLAAFLSASAVRAQGPGEDRRSFLEDLKRRIPAEVSVVMDGSNTENLRLSGPPKKSSFAKVRVKGPGFSRAIEVHVFEATEKPWDVQLQSQALSGALRRGQQLLVVLHVRSLEDQPATLHVILQQSRSPWTSLVERFVVAGRDWKCVYLLARIEQDFAQGQVELSLHLGSRAQRLQVGGIAAVRPAKPVDEKDLPFTPLVYDGRQADAPWRKAALERIEKIRKGDLTVQVVDTAGQPVSGASVRAKMLRHSYGFGTFLESRMILDSSEEGRRYRQWNLKMFNRCTTPIYWADWGWANPKHRRQMLACARWAARENLPTRGHVIIYPGWQFLPSAVRRLQGDPAALRLALARHVADVVRQTRDLNFREYDVTNELRHLTEIHSLLGRDVVAQWFRIAREHAAPTSAMAINENSILTHGGFTRAQQDNYLAWIRTLDQAGQAPEVLGIQGHFAGAPTAPSRVLEILDRFGKTGIPIQITEFDFDTRDEHGQADYLRDFLTAVFSHPATEAFTVWGFWEGRMWRPRGAMLRKDWTLKPNGQVWMDLVKGRWWTDEAGQSDPQGRWSLRGFCGSYEVIVTHKGRSRNVQLQLETDGALKRVVLSDKSSPEDTSE